MEDLYTLAACTNCGGGRNLDNNIYKTAIFYIPDLGTLNYVDLGANKFFGYSITVKGDLIYKSNSSRIKIQPLEFPGRDAVYVKKIESSTNPMWVIGV
jgi:hypothetical protein